MITTVTAIYENGVLRLQEPLDLPDGQVLQVQIMTAGAADDPIQQAKRLAAYERLIALTSDQPLPPWSEIKEVIEGRFDDQAAGR